MSFATEFAGKLHKHALTLAAMTCAALWAAPAAAAEKITYLLPAPPSLPAFAPWVLAKHLGYYAEAGYDVDFVVARGGVDVAKQIGVGNAPIGGAIGDTPIIVRGNGVPVKAVGKGDDPWDRFGCNEPSVKCLGSELGVLGMTGFEAIPRDYDQMLADIARAYPPPAAK